MAVTSIMTTGPEIAAKMGANVSSGFTETMQDAEVLQAESTVNVWCRNNYSDLVTAGLNSDVKGILSDWVASLVAIQGILYDMSGYTSRGEAEDMITMLQKKTEKIQSMLLDKKKQDFVDKA